MHELINGGSLMCTGGSQKCIDGPHSVKYSGSDYLRDVTRNQYNAYFNPRSREGSDEAMERWRENNGKISIHAPARGATTPENLKEVKVQFQSTLPRGERLYFCIKSQLRIHDFNPRSREGSDRFCAFGFQCLNYFNPRSREGSDCVLSAPMHPTI